MKLNELLLGSAICIGIAGLAVVSNVLLDRYLPRQLEQKADAAAPAGSPCVDAKGSWVNWPWPNVPTLSPNCAGTPAGPEAPTAKK